MIIDVKNLCKNYKTYKRGETFGDSVKSIFKRDYTHVEALKGVSFSMKKGELTGLIGPNGAGKSTMMKILTGILYPTSGEVKVLGYVPWKERKKYVRNIGAVFGQKSQLIWDIPAIDAFNMNKAIYSIPDKDYRNTLNNLTDILTLGDLIKKPVRQLSLGERMKCEFIMAMLHNPEIVFLDEPTIGLDVVARDTIRKFITELNRSGTTFILTTHDLSDIEHLCSRVIVINHGNVEFDNTLNKLKEYSDKKRTIQLKTASEISIIETDSAEIINRISPYEVKLTLDTNIKPVSEFVNQVDKEFKLLDMSIEEIAIEEIIKNMYQKD
jgi:ABC-2 type transport system ATP-binding protein